MDTNHFCCFYRRRFLSWWSGASLRSLMGSFLKSSRFSSSLFYRNTLLKELIQTALNVCRKSSCCAHKGACTAAGLYKAVHEHKRTCVAAPAPRFHITVSATVNWVQLPPVGAIHPGCAAAFLHGPMMDSENVRSHPSFLLARRSPAFHCWRPPRGGTGEPGGNRGLKWER